MRDQIDRIVKQVEAKENEIYDEIEKLGVSKLKRHGQESGFFDALGLSQGNPSIGNISLYEAFIAKDPEGCHSHVGTFNKLHAYLGVKARALDALVEIHQDFLNKVAKGD